MTKEEYINQLYKALKGYPTQFRRETLDTYEELLDSCIAKGMSDDEAIDQIGTVEEVMENIRMVNGDFDARNHENDEFRDSLKNFASTVKDAVVDLGGAISSSLTATRTAFTSVQSRTPCEIVTVIAPGVKSNVALIPGEKLQYAFVPEKRAELTTSFENGHATFMMNKGNGSLTIRIPDYVSSVRINTGSGFVRAEEYKGQELMIIVKKADAVVTRCECDSFVADCESGDVEVRDSLFNIATVTNQKGDVSVLYTGSRINITTGTGDVNVTSSSFASIDVTTDTGDIRAAVSSCPFRAVMNTSGDITNKTYYPYAVDPNGNIRVGEGQNVVRLKSRKGDIDLL